MELTINPQKILRTGDVVINKNTGLRGTIHYLYEKGGQTTFEHEVSKLEAVQFDNGEKIIDVKINEIDLIRS